MLRIALITPFILMAAALHGADNPWDKVRELKSGAELRIFKKGAREPVVAKFDEAKDDRIAIVLKNEQVSIPKEEIDRIDARPAIKSSRKVTVDSRVKTTDPDYTPHPAPAIPAPGTSWSSGVSVGGGGKPDFETVYRRVQAAPKRD